MPILTIIIPAYNAERFIENILSLLISQGLDNCEVIVVNDGSTDKTESIIKSYVEKYESIKVLSIPNSGVSVARNTGLLIASGKYIYFLDSDDALAPDTISFFKETIYKHPTIDIFSFGYESRIADERFKEYRNPYYSMILFDSTQQFLKLFFSKRINCHICATIISYNLLKENSISFSPGLKIGEDIEFLINIFSKAKTFFYDSRLCFIYQIRDDSAMQGYKTYSITHFNFFILLKNIIYETIERMPDISNNANFFLANAYCSNLYSYLKSKFKDNDINQKFLLNKRVLFTDMTGKFKNIFIIFIIRFVPLKLLFFIFRKYCNDTD
jgi:glycosyltransferase involved in cell wall biosynthesis